MEFSACRYIFFFSLVPIFYLPCWRRVNCAAVEKEGQNNDRENRNRRAVFIRKMSKQVTPSCRLLVTSRFVWSIKHDHGLRGYNFSMY